MAPSHAVEALHQRRSPLRRQIQCIEIRRSGLGQFDRDPAFAQSEVVPLLRLLRLDLHAQPFEASPELATGEVRADGQDLLDDRSGRCDRRIDGASIEDLRPSDVDTSGRQGPEDLRETALEVQSQGEFGIGRSPGETRCRPDLGGRELVRGLLIPLLDDE